MFRSISGVPIRELDSVVVRDIVNTYPPDPDAANAAAALVRPSLLLLSLYAFSTSLAGWLTLADGKERQLNFSVSFLFL